MSAVVTFLALLVLVAAVMAGLGYVVLSHLPGGLLPA